MLKEISKSDIITRPIKVYKEWTLDENDIFPIFGENPNNTFIDVDSDAKSQGFNKKVIYESIKAQFYTNPATASALFEVGLRKSYASTDERVLENEMAIISIPQRYYGEGIKVGTVILEDETLSRTYTDDGYSNLLDSGSNIKGNIFYDRGLVVVTKDVVSGSVLNQFTLNYRSTKTIYENEIFISVLENEFNVSQNPSAVDFNGSDYGKIKLHTVTSSLDPTKTGGFADYEYSSSLDRTGSYLAPYITTIGLYDDELNMVAVAKLPQPIKSLPDYPVNFIIRFDT
jgi:predicted RNA-binding protein